MLTNKQIGEEIRNRRMALGLSQAKLGKAIGHSHATISDIERGIREITISDLSLIADELSIPLIDLLNIEYEYNTITVQQQGIILTSSGEKQVKDNNYNQIIQFTQ